MPEMKMVCLIGSMRFYDIMLHEATEIHKLGHLALIPFKDNEDIIPKERLESYDNLIRKMIMISDIVYVINKGGYIGESVQSEINFARENNKRIVYYESSIETKTITLIGSFKFRDQFEFIKRALDSSLDKDYKYRFLTYLPEFYDIPEFYKYMTDDQIHDVHMIFSRKIEKSDAIIVINVPEYNYQANDKYVGEDTTREVNLADSYHKQVIYLSSIYFKIQLDNNDKNLVFNNETGKDMVISKIIEMINVKEKYDKSKENNNG